MARRQFLTACIASLVAPRRNDDGTSPPTSWTTWVVSDHRRGRAAVVVVGLNAMIVQCKDGKVAPAQTRSNFTHTMQPFRPMVHNSLTFQRLRSLVAKLYPPSRESDRDSTRAPKTALKIDLRTRNPGSQKKRSPEIRAPCAAPARGAVSSLRELTRLSAYSTVHSNSSTREGGAGRPCKLSERAIKQPCDLVTLDNPASLLHPACAAPLRLEHRYGPAT